MSIKSCYKFFYKYQIILLIALLLGCYFRTSNLDGKIFWVDEVSTAVRVSGYTVPQVNNALSQQGIVDFNDLLIYQTVTADKTFINSWNAFTKSPEHAPLYFVLTRVWTQIWGSSITAIRSLAVVFSLLVFPALYWLCQELFNRVFISKMAVILMSVSPFFVAYAQEARPYSLWTVTILLMSASLIRAIRINCKQSWLLYSLCLTLGLYTSLFSIYVALFQLIYLLATPVKNKLKAIKNYLISSLLSLLAFSPWIFIIISQLDLLQKNTSWMRGNFNLAEIIAVFIGTVLLVFGDLPISQDSDPVQIVIALIVILFALSGLLILSRRGNKKLFRFALLFIISSSIFIFTHYIYLDLISIVGALVALIILSLSGYSLYYLITNTSRDCWLYIVCLMLSLPVPLLVADIINQGQSSTAPRYLIPLQLGIQIAVAYTLGNKIIASEFKFWRGIVIVFLTIGIFSCVRNLNLSPFYQKGRNINNPAIAAIIDRSKSLVIAESNNTMDILSLAYSLSNQTKYKIIDNQEDVTKYINTANVFIIKPSIELQQILQQNPEINFYKVYQSHLFSADEIPLDLWRLKAKSVENPRRRKAQGNARQDS